VTDNTWQLAHGSGTWQLVPSRWQWLLDTQHQVVPLPPKQRVWLLVHNQNNIRGYHIGAFVAFFRKTDGFISENEGFISENGDFDRKNGDFDDILMGNGDFDEILIGKWGILIEKWEFRRDFDGKMVFYYKKTVFWSAITYREAVFLQ
jgi:hypothetical protein